MESSIILYGFSFLTARLNLCYTDLVIIRYLVIQPFPLKSVLPFYLFLLLPQGRHMLGIQKIIIDCWKPCLDMHRLSFYFWSVIEKNKIWTQESKATSTHSFPLPSPRVPIRKIFALSGHISSDKIEIKYSVLIQIIGEHARNAESTPRGLSAGEDAEWPRSPIYFPVAVISHLDSQVWPGCHGQTC